ncbi:MAG TPA: hypothetical protein VIM28_03850 [Solirubrobacterales bacterium]
MPSTTIEISREQRQPLHRLVTQHISGIGDVYLMIEQGDFATAERFGLEFGEDIRMLNDLGWNPDDARDSYALTQPRHELIEALKRLRLDAEDGLDAPEDEKRKREEYDELIAYFTRARDLCAELIDALDTRGVVSLTIDRGERDSLQGLMAYRFFTAGDLRFQRSVESGVTREEQARELEQDAQLMQDLGWFDRELAEALHMPEADQDEFELTLPTEALAATLKRAREDARVGFADGLKQTPTETDEERRARFQLAEQTCDELLARLGNQEEAPA